MPSQPKQQGPPVLTGAAALLTFPAWCCLSCGEILAAPNLFRLQRLESADKHRCESDTRESNTMSSNAVREAAEMLVALEARIQAVEAALPSH